MADFVDNGVVVSDDDSRDSVHISRDQSKEETDTSNNSSSQKKSQTTTPKSGKARGDKTSSGHGSSRSQHARRGEALEQIRRRMGKMFGDNTKAFINFLGRPNIDARDVKSKVFKNQLMLSENMDEVPPGFAKNWLMVACPVGSRCLVVANMGHTGAYTKTGYHIISHPSCLPMGNKAIHGYGACVLDCIYCNEAETYFVLDMMCWDGQPLYDYDTQSRFRLLQDKIREYDLGRPSRQNPYPFVPLKTFTPTKSNICVAIKMAPYMIDGLLFYHKQGTYVPGSTPLVLWLTLDRLPTKMKIEIPEMGIVTAVNYKDPVALALAHGVSPAIISQVYPSGRNALAAQGRNAWSQGQNGHAQGGRRYHEFHGSVNHEFHGPVNREFHGPVNREFHGPVNREFHGPVNREFHGPLTRGYEQGRQGYYPRQSQRRGHGLMRPNDDFAYLSDMMMGLDLMHTGSGPYGPFERQMMGSGGPFYHNYNSNNSNMYYNRGGRGRQGWFQQQHRQQGKSKQQQKKKKKGQSGRQSAQDEAKFANWEEPHGVMRSQWMITKPEDFENEYLTCVCPMAKRRIIVAANGKTCTYNKYGKLVDSFTSSLPNGHPSPASGEKSKDLTVLDCLWCGSFQKFFVIDVMHWRQQPFYDAEAEFRFFWLADKISDVTLKSGKKEYGVEILAKLPSNKESIMAALSKVDFKVDGLLCFQRNSKYSQVAGVNALWLKLDMMEELLGYSPPDDVTFKPSTEKERKQRAYFMNLKNKEKESQADATAATNGSNDDEDEEAQSTTTE